jgi:hypothetical protein
MNQVAMTDSFQEKIFARIRESVGDLMTDEDLRKLVDAAMQKAFFTEVTVQGNYYNSSRVEPPHLVQLVRELLKERVTAAVDLWLKEHPEEVTKAIKESIEKGIFGMIQSYVDSKTRWPLEQLQQQLMNSGLLK